MDYSRGIINDPKRQKRSMKTGFQKKLATRGQGMGGEIGMGKVQYDIDGGYWRRMEC